VYTFQSGGTAPTPTVTYNAVSMNEIANQLYAGGTVERLCLFELVAPATGAHDIVATGVAADDVELMALSYTGVDQADPTDAPVIDASAFSSVSVNVTSQLGDVVADGVASFTAEMEVHPAQTLRNSFAGSASFNDWGVSDQPGAATVNMSWRLQSGTEDDYVHIAVNVNAADLTAATMLATADQGATDVVNELDATSPLFSSVNDDPDAPDDADWINNDGGTFG
jgi:hypothetical protein